MKMIKIIDNNKKEHSVNIDHITRISRYDEEETNEWEIDLMSGTILFLDDNNMNKLVKIINKYCEYIL